MVMVDCAALVPRKAVIGGLPELWAFWKKEPDFKNKTSHLNKKRPILYSCKNWVNTWAPKHTSWKYCNVSVSLILLWLRVLYLIIGSVSLRCIQGLRDALSPLTPVWYYHVRANPKSQANAVRTSSVKIWSRSRSIQTKILSHYFLCRDVESSALIH